MESSKQLLENWSKYLSNIGLYGLVKFSAMSIFGCIKLVSWLNSVYQDVLVNVLWAGKDTDQKNKDLLYLLPR